MCEFPIGQGDQVILKVSCPKEAGCPPTWHGSWEGGEETKNLHHVKGLGHTEGSTGGPPKILEDTLSFEHLPNPEEL